MNMPLSVSTKAKLFPRKIDDVTILINNTKQRDFVIPPEGKVVVVKLNTGKLRDEFGDKIGTANFYDIVAFYNGTTYYETSLRMSRWISRKPRFMIERRLAAKIRRAAKHLR